MGDDAQPRFSLLAGADNHAAMELALSALASWLSTFALELIDRSFDHRLMRKKGPDKLPDLIGELNKGLSESTEFLSVCSVLYAHKYISIQIMVYNASKKSMSSKKSFGST